MSEAELSASDSNSRWRFVPGLGLIARYKINWLRGDLVSGVILAAYLLPAGIADASLANLPPEAGLYACLFSGLLFWLLCSSSHTVSTTTSALSLLVAASLAELTRVDSTRSTSLAACLAILVGLLALLTWIARAGVVINFVSETVLLGFKAGIALILASTQLPKLLGFGGSHGSFFHRMSHFVSHLNESNAASALIGISALLTLLLGKRFLKKLPIALLVVIAGTLLVSVTDVAARGVKLLGEVPHGLPRLGWPDVTADEMNDLLLPAVACFLMAAVETAAIGRMFALKHGRRFDPNQELLALAASNVFAGFGRGFPTSGGMSQSLVNESGGARTPVSGLVAALITLMIVIFFSGLLRNLPQPVLAAIVLSAVTGLFKLDAMKRLWRFSRSEFAVSSIAFVGVLQAGILRGVLLGALLSLILLLRRASRPHTTELGCVPGTNFFADAIRHPENLREPEVFIFRTEGAILYFNADNVHERFNELLEQHGPGVRLVVIYLGMVPLIDLAGAELLTEMCRAMKERNVAVRLAETHGQVRESLRRAEIGLAAGAIHANQTVASVIEQWRRDGTTTSS